jgi:hypothetical protein
MPKTANPCHMMTGNRRSFVRENQQSHAKLAYGVGPEQLR